MDELLFPPGLKDRLPRVRGRVSENASLSKVTWFRVGGPAEILFKPADEEDLSQFLAGLAEDIPLTFLGVGSNLLVRDGGVPGVTIRLGREFAKIERDGDSRIKAGGGALDGNVALLAQQNALAGLEFLSGIPGTIGGALRMNAGAYGSEMKDILVSAQGITRSGQIKSFTLDDMGFGYRTCALQGDLLFTSALLQGEPGDADHIAKRMDDIQAARGDSQPVRSRTGGSTFANPDGHKAWQLVDKAGCRGLKRGGAMVSEQHCNFLINTGEATADDLEGLGDEVKRRVFETSGIDLQWEIRRIGVTKEARA